LRQLITSEIDACRDKDLWEEVATQETQHVKQIGQLAEQWEAVIAAVSEPEANTGEMA